MKFFYCAVLLCFMHLTSEAQDVNDWVRYGNYPNTGIYSATPSALLAKPVMISKKQGCKVESFDMYGEAYKAKRDIGPVSSDGANISPAQRKLIMKTGNNGTIWIYNVKLTCNDGSKHTFGKGPGSLAVYYFKLVNKK
ncbi:hypothetical protein CAP35_00680 [Chitinophagaceae bacterium IBVUCB1]|nr:hypothetical protein CAP35_00680 [Chitinophagaceae bacterium IBVUCB1]